MSIFSIPLCKCRPLQPVKMEKKPKTSKTTKTAKMARVLSVVGVSSQRASFMPGAKNIKKLGSSELSEPQSQRADFVNLSVA